MRRRIGEDCSDGARCYGKCDEETKKCVAGGLECPFQDE